MTADVRVLVAVVTVITVVGLCCGVAGIADHIAVAVLIGAGPVWFAVAVLRRELRIRARLADPRTQPAPRPSGVLGGVPHSWAGSGERTPVPSTPTTRPRTDAGPGDARPSTACPATRTGGAR